MCCLSSFGKRGLLTRELYFSKPTLRKEGTSNLRLNSNVLCMGDTEQEMRVVVRVTSLHKWGNRCNGLYFVFFFERCGLYFVDEGITVVPGNQKSEISPRVIFSHASDGVLAAFLFQVHEKNSG